MEYSSTKKVRLPGISNLFPSSDEDEDSYISNEEEEECYSQNLSSENYNSAALRNQKPTGTKLFTTPTKPRNFTSKSANNSPTKPPSRRQTISPTSLVIHATAEALVADVPEPSLGEILVEGVLGLFGVGEAEAVGVKGDGGMGGVVNEDVGGEICVKDAKKEEVKSNVEGVGVENDCEVGEWKMCGKPVVAANWTSPVKAIEHEMDSATPLEAEPEASPLNTSNQSAQSEESYFYIGGEEGFCPSTSVHDSDISETDSECEDETFETEDEDDSEQSEQSAVKSELLSGFERFEESAVQETSDVNLSIFTECASHDPQPQTNTLVSMALDSSILTEILGEEKKEEFGAAYTDIVNESQTDGCNNTDCGNEESEQLEDSLQSDIQALTKYHSYANESFHRSISSPALSHYKHITNTPIPQANDDSCLSEGSDFVSSSFKNFVSHHENNLTSLLSSIEGMTTTPARIEKVVKQGLFEEDDLDDCHRLGLTPLKSTLDSVDWNHIGYGGQTRLEKMTEEGGLYSSPLQTDDLKHVAEEMEYRGAVLFHSPPDMTVEHVGEEAEHRSGVLFASPPSVEFGLEVEGSGQKLEVQEESQSSLLAVDLKPQAGKSTPSSVDGVDEEEDIPSSVLEMFANAESALQKELAFLDEDSPTNKPADQDTFCEDYIKPHSESEPQQTDANSHSNNNQLPFASPTDHAPIDTANLNNSTFETTGINLDSLKEVLNMESAASPFEKETKLEDEGSEAETTFETAQFCMDSLVNAVDDFFDAREEEEIVNSEQTDGDVAVEVGETVKDFASAPSPVDPNGEGEKSLALKREELLFESSNLLDTCSTEESDGNVDVTLTLDRVEEYLKRMTMAETEIESSMPNCGSLLKECIMPTDSVEKQDTLKIASDTDAKITLRHCTATTLDSSSISDAMDISMVPPDDSVPTINAKLESMDNNEELAAHGSGEELASIANCSSNQQIKIVDESKPNGCDTSVMDISMAPPDDSMPTTDANPESMGKNEEPAAHGFGEESASIANDSSHQQSKIVDDSKPNECDMSAMDASPISNGMNESMFMPNMSMDLTLIASPLPATTPEQPLQTMSEEEEDSGTLSDEEFFPNRNLAKKTSAKTTAAKSVSSGEEKVSVPAKVAPTTRARSQSFGKDEHKHDVNSVSSSSLRVKTSLTKSNNTVNHTGVSVATLARRTRLKPKSPPSEIKPAKKRSKLSTITNTADSPKRITTGTVKAKTITAESAPLATKSVAPQKQSSLSSKQTKIPACIVSKQVNKPRKAEPTSRSKQSKSIPASTKPKHVGVSPRTSSLRRSLVAVAKSQKQINVSRPKPPAIDNITRSERLARLAKPRSIVKKARTPPKKSTSIAREAPLQKMTPRGPSVGNSNMSRSERLERLSQPRSVVKKEKTPLKKTASQKKFSTSKPPSFLNRESRKSTVKSSAEREEEEMSSIKPFKARKVKGSSAKVKSRYNTPRSPSPNPNRSKESNGRPFKSLKEEIMNYDFREQPPAITMTPLNLKKISTPSFMERETPKGPKQSVPTLGESLQMYNFRATPSAMTPINTNAKPPSFLRRPSPATSYHVTKSSEELELEECKNKFMACPLPISTTKPRPPSRPRETRALTTPRPPKLHTSARSDMKTPVRANDDDIELQKQFIARPLPVSYRSRFGPDTPRRSTPKPSQDEVELSKKYHALPLPSEIYGKSLVENGIPFHIRAEQQYERAMEKKQQMIEEEMEQMKRDRERKATPLPPTNWEARPIRIRKSEKELVQPTPPRLSLDARSRYRKQFDEHVKQTRDMKAMAEAAQREEETRAEEEEMRRLRSLTVEEGGLCFRAKPVNSKD